MDWVFFSYHLSWFQRDITLGPEQQDFAQLLEIPFQFQLFGM